MGIRLLVDEDLQAKRLVQMLRTAGHDVMTASEAGLDGASDESVLSRATGEGRSVLTRNADHFRHARVRTESRGHTRGIRRSSRQEEHEP